MTSLKIKDLPGSPKMEIRPMITDDPAEGPHVEVANVRVRRSGPGVHCEAANDEGEWFHWYVIDDPDLPYGMVSLGQSMLVARALALKIPQSDAARLVGRHAPRAAALARYSSTSVNGATAVAIHLPTATDQNSRPPGLAMEDANLTTLAPIPLSDSLGTVVNESWIDGSMVIPETGWAVFSECVALGQEFGKLGSSEQRRLLEGPKTNWESSLSRGTAVVADIAKLTESALTIVKAFRA